MVMQYVKSRVDVDPETGCWLWKQCKYTTGYAMGFVNGKKDRIHRAVFFHLNPDVSREFFVLHSCDVRHCVNPAHLRAGTPLENFIDRTERPKEWQKRKILTAQEVLDARALFRLGFSKNQISKTMGIERTVVTHLCKGTTYKHIEPSN